LRERIDDVRRTRSRAGRREETIRADEMQSEEEDELEDVMAGMRPAGRDTAAGETA
jgi:hypothetical protein